MNVNTGELRRLVEGNNGAVTIEVDGEEFTPVPKGLQPEAEGLLGDKNSVHVDLAKKPRTPLTIWALREKRAKIKRMNKKKR